MDKSTKVLIHGYNQSNFLIPIFKYISLNSKSRFSFYAYNIRILGEEDDFKEPVIKPIAKKISANKFEIFKGVAFLPFNSLTYLYLKNIFRDINQVKSDLKNLMLKKAYEKAFKKFDIVNIQFCSPQYLIFIPEIPKKTKVICSIWGSDFLQESSPLGYKIQARAFERADIITIQSLELKQIFLCKYGFHLNQKIKIIPFGLSQNLFDDIKQLVEEKELRLKLQKSIGLNTLKTRVVIGYNRSRNNNHIPIIQSLKELDTQIKRRILIIIPFGYGAAEKDYRHEIINLLETCGIEFLILEDFLKNSELAVLRLSSDILIQMPLTDALSATVTEVLYGDNIVIAGSWLPYKFFKKRVKDRNFIEIDSFNVLPAVIKDLVLLNSRKDIKLNEELREVSIENLGPSWVQLFSELDNRN